MPASGEPLVMCVGMHLVQLVMIVIVTILEPVMTPIVTPVAVLFVIVIPCVRVSMLG